MKEIFFKVGIGSFNFLFWRCQFFNRSRGETRVLKWVEHSFWTHSTVGWKSSFMAGCCLGSYGPWFQSPALNISKPQFKQWFLLFVFAWESPISSMSSVSKSHVDLRLNWHFLLGTLPNCLNPNHSIVSPNHKDSTNCSGHYILCTLLWC